MVARTKRAGMVNRAGIIVSSGGAGDYVIGPAVDETHVSPVDLLTDGDEFDAYRFHDSDTFEWGPVTFRDGPTPVLERGAPEFSSAGGTKVDFPAVANTVLLAWGPPHLIGVSSHGLLTNAGVLQGLADLAPIVAPDSYKTAGKSWVPHITDTGGADAGGGALTPVTWGQIQFGAFGRSLADADTAAAARTALGLDTLPIKYTVKAASTGNLTLSGEQTVDGVPLIDGDRVLAKDQTAAAENGLYVVADGAAWERAADADAWAELPGAIVHVESGTANGDTNWQCTADQGGVLDTTAIEFIRFLGTGVKDALAVASTYVASIAALTALDVTKYNAGHVVIVADTRRGGEFVLKNAAYTANPLTICAPDTPSGNLHWVRRMKDDGRINVLWADSDADDQVSGSDFLAAIALGNAWVPPSATVLFNDASYAEVTGDDVVIYCEGTLKKGATGTTGCRISGDRARIYGSPTLDLNDQSGKIVLEITGADAYIENPILIGGGGHHIIGGIGADGAIVDRPYMPDGSNSSVTCPIVFDQANDVTIIEPNMNEWSGFCIQARISSAGAMSNFKVVGGKFKLTPTDDTFVVTSGAGQTGHTFTIPTDATRYALLADDGSSLAYDAGSPSDNGNGTSDIAVTYPSQTAGGTLTFRAWRGLEPIQANGPIENFEIDGAVIDGSGDAGINSVDDYATGAVKSVKVRNVVIKNCMRPGIMEDCAVARADYANVTITDCGQGFVAADPGGGPWDNVSVSQDSSASIRSYGNKAIDSFFCVNTAGRKAARPLFINGNDSDDTGDANKPIRIGRVQTSGDFLEGYPYLAQTSSTRIGTGVFLEVGTQRDYPEVLDMNTSVPVHTDWTAWDPSGSPSLDTVNKIDGRNTVSIPAGTYVDVIPRTESAAAADSFFTDGVAEVEVRCMAAVADDDCYVEILGRFDGSTIRSRNVKVQTAFPQTVLLTMPMRGLWSLYSCRIGGGTTGAIKIASVQFRVRHFPGVGSNPFSGFASIPGVPANTEPTGVTYSAGDFTGSGSMSWTVAVGDMSELWYAIKGKLMTVGFKIEATTVSGTPGRWLQITIPAGKTCSRSADGVCLINDNLTGWAVGHIFVPGGSGTLIKIEKPDSSNWAASTDQTYVSGEITFAID